MSWRRASLGEALVESLGLSLLAFFLGGVPLLCGLYLLLAAIEAGHWSGYVIAAVTGIVFWIPVVAGAAILWLFGREILVTRKWYVRSADPGRQGWMRLRRGRVVEADVRRSQTVTRGVRPTEYAEHSKRGLQFEEGLDELIARALVGLHARGAVVLQFVLVQRWYEAPKRDGSIHSASDLDVQIKRASGRDAGWLEEHLLAQVQAEPRPLVEVVRAAAIAISAETRTPEGFRARIKKGRRGPESPPPTKTAMVDEQSVAEHDRGLTKSIETALGDASP